MSGCNRSRELGIPWRDLSTITDSDPADEVINYPLPEQTLTLIKERKIIPQFMHVDYLPTDENFVQISTGEEHVFLLTESGQMYCSGSNSVGQLGVTVEGSTTFVKHTFMKEPVKLIHCLLSSTIFITQSDQVYICGENGVELGFTSSQSCIYVPIRHTLLCNKGVTKIIGSNNMFAFTNTNEIYCWGTNENNELGLESDLLNNHNMNQGVHAPMRHHYLEKISKIAKDRGYDMEIAAGFNHTVVYFKQFSKSISLMFSRLESASHGESASEFSDIIIKHHNQTILVATMNQLKRKTPTISENISPLKKLKN